jgi:hypothetical protein
MDHWGEPFPVEALGDIMGPAVQAIANKVQISPSVAAQSVLALPPLSPQITQMLRHLGAQEYFLYP